ncbi:MAG: PhoX family phosphatase [Myxococcota bacterium]|nr:PhoX family phosphatase [Myxococcota bacterium]
MPAHLSDLISRRLFLGTLAASAAIACAPKAPPAAPAPAPPAPPAPEPGLTFAEVSRGIDDRDHIAAGYTAQVLLRRGDPILPGAPAFDASNLTAAAQAQQFGDCCDFIAFIPLTPGASDHGLLCVNHEFALSPLLWAGDGGDWSTPPASQPAERVGVEQAAMGMSVVEIKRGPDGWQTVAESPYSRRITTTTPHTLTGPVAGHARVKTPADPEGRTVLGTMENCSGGVTPWGTVLSGEENITHHFIARDDGAAKAGPEGESLAAMRFHGRPAMSWYATEDRWDLDKHPGESCRHGWVIEVDPKAPDAAPVKRTALGRFFHEGAEVHHNADGRVIVYMGDDTDNQHLYRFVSAQPWAQGEDPSGILDAGTLSVAQFTEGTLTWLPLTLENPVLAARFDTLADLLIDTRIAAGLVDATPMDRPERVAVSPISGQVYVVLTKGSRREEANAPNPRAPNRYGHIIELLPPGGDHTAEAFSWGIFLLAGNPADPEHGAQCHADVSSDGWIARPDNAAFDPLGRLWITTDGAESYGSTDGVYACTVDGAARALTRLLYRAPTGAELTGPAFTPDGATLFVSVQHPGATEAGTFEAPETRWPDFDAAIPPRSSVVAIVRDDGGTIGG